MQEPASDTIVSAPRRSLFGRLAATTAIGLAALSTRAHAEKDDPARSDGSEWPGKLPGAIVKWWTPTISTAASRSLSPSPS